MTTGEKTKRLSELDLGRRAWIIGLADEDGLSKRLLEMGFVEGAEVEVLHEGPFGGDPIAVRVRGALIAVRRSEAARILIGDRRDREGASC